MLLFIYKEEYSVIILDNFIQLSIEALLLSRPALVAQLDASQLVIRRLRVWLPPGRQHSFMDIDHEIFSMIILSLPLIQEGQLSVSGKRMCIVLVNSLED